MAGACRKKMCIMARDVAGPIFLRSSTGLTLQAARKALPSPSLIQMLPLPEDGGNRLFLTFQQLSWSYLQGGQQGIKKVATRCCSMPE
jgi:hypothetical protein